MILIIFLTPLVIDPLFNKFEPLADHDAQLVSDLERVVNRAGLEIPPQRMFLMKASEKVKFVNAYVTGLGASKRVVVWDTTIAKMTRPQILYVFGHEMGHYVLNHIYKGLIVAAFGLLVCFFLTARISRRWLERHSADWKIRGPADWAALPVYAIPILLLTIRLDADQQRLLAVRRASGRSIRPRSYPWAHAGFGPARRAIISNSR